MILLLLSPIPGEPLQQDWLVKSCVFLLDSFQFLRGIGVVCVLSYLKWRPFVLKYLSGATIFEGKSYSL